MSLMASCCGAGGGCASCDLTAFCSYSEPEICDYGVGVHAQSLRACVYAVVCVCGSRTR